MQIWRRARVTAFTSLFCFLCSLDLLLQHSPGLAFGLPCSMCGHFCSSFLCMTCSQDSQVGRQILLLFFARIWWCPFLILFDVSLSEQICLAFNWILSSQVLTTKVAFVGFNFNFFLFVFNRSKSVFSLVYCFFVI